MEKTKELVIGGKSRSKEEGKLTSGGSSWRQNLKRENNNNNNNNNNRLTLKKLQPTDHKMTPDSPTCAIDAADELIMKGKIELDKAENDEGEEKKARKGCSKLNSDTLDGHSVKTPLYSSLVGRSAETALTPPPLRRNFLLRPRESLKASFLRRRESLKSSSRATKDQLSFAKVAPSLSQPPTQAPAAPDLTPAPTLTAYTPASANVIAPVSAGAVSAAFAPPLAG